MFVLVLNVFDLRLNSCIKKTNVLPAVELQTTQNVVKKSSVCVRQIQTVIDLLILTIVVHLKITLLHYVSYTYITL